MASVGDTCATYGVISEHEASTAVNRIESALNMIDTPLKANDVLGYLGSIVDGLVGKVLGFANIVIGLGIYPIKTDLSDQENFYSDIIQMYADDKSIIGIKIKQDYIYRRCQETFGWYINGLPELIAIHYPGGWEPVN